MNQVINPPFPSQSIIRSSVDPYLKTWVLFDPNSVLLNSELKQMTEHFSLDQLLFP